MTYYISPYGSDITGNGSLVAPWLTLYKACQMVTTAGDIIFVQAGNYTLSAGQVCNLSPGVNIDGAGSASSIITSTIVGSRHGDRIINPTINLVSTTQNTPGNQYIRN